MNVYVVIELTGSAHEVDGAIVHGVYANRDDAEADVVSMPERARSFTEIQEHKLEEASWRASTSASTG